MLGTMSVLNLNIICILLKIYGNYLECYIDTVQ